MNNFEFLLKSFTGKLNAELDQLARRKPQLLYEPICYSLEMGGKRIRPILLLIAYELYRSDIEKALNAAIAIEVFHNFTLLHDDIMDNARLRRSKETVHVKYSENTAILSGDAMSILSYEFLSKNEAGNLEQQLKLFTKTALQICEGQQLDMDFESNPSVTIPDYIEMIGLKTAVLLAASLKMGALVANAPEYDSECLYNIGYNLGLAFQLQDDLLDTFGTKEEFGKNLGGDIVSNKKTFLLLSALQLADKEQRTELNKWISATEFDKEEKIACIKKIFSELNIEKVTLQQIDYYYNKSMEHFEKLPVSPEKKSILLETVNKLMKRKS